MTKREYDLEKRTFVFAKNVRAFVKKLKKTIANIEDENVQEKARKELEKESTELMNIFGSILRKSE